MEWYNERPSAPMAMLMKEHGEGRREREIELLDV